jgi:5-methylcytosine-specific restriction protein B
VYLVRVEAAGNVGTFLEAARGFDPASAKIGQTEAEEQLAETIRQYPADRWPEMRVEEYAMGDPAHPDNFCRWIERQTDQMGSIRGGSARKLIIYKRANEQGWYFPSEYAGVEAAWQAVRAGFAEAIALAGEARWEEIDGIDALKPGPALVAKTLWAYFPDELLPITSSGHLRHFLRAAGDEPSAADHELGTLALNRALLRTLRAVRELHGLSTKELERLLYTRLSPFEGRLIKIAPGRDGMYWDDCLAGGYVCVGWDDVGDLRRFDSKEEFLQTFEDRYLGNLYSARSKLAEKANELWLLLDVGAGERIVANQGTSKVLGVGVVEPPEYVWDDARPEYKHTLRVDWDTSFAKQIPSQGRWAVKTVMPVTAKVRELILGDTGIGSGEEMADGRAGTTEPLLAEIAALLARKAQVVLYGPPGTGKTWTARRFARWWLRRQNERSSPTVSDAPSHEAGQSEGADDGRWWWVTTNPAQWAWDELFEKGEEVFRRGLIARNYDQIKAGDLVIGYTARPRRRIETVARVKRIETIEEGPTFVLEPVSRVHEGPTWHELQQDAVLAESEPIHRRMQGTLFALTGGEAARLLDMVARRDPALAKKLRGRSSRAPETLEWITFHASYSYEDFVEGFRPVASEEGTQLALVPGVFKEFARRAERDPDRSYLLVIDEINRANITKVFGELITLLEKDKRGFPVRLPYSKEEFAIPENLYIVGTMNTADRSIKLVDTALRRRFGWKELMPDEDVLVGATVAGVRLDLLLRELNRRIARFADRDKQIGHSYFLRDEQPITDPDEFTQVFRTEIVPLLQEYAYDDYEDLAEYLGERIVDREALKLNGTVLADPSLLLEALDEHLDGGTDATLPDR